MTPQALQTLIANGEDTRHPARHQPAARAASQSNIRVADYLTLLSPRATLHAKLHQSIAIARQKLGNRAHP